jgi:flagellin-like hook-associated protein FlgL
MTRNVHSFIGGPAISTGVSANDGAWHHLAVTWQSSNGDLKVFKDGVVDYSGTLSAGSTMMPAGSLVIGQEQDSIGGNFESNQAFIGSIDEIRIWNHSRTQAEIQTTMNTILDGDESGLVGYWNFNDGTAIDLSGNGNHGTLHGSAQIPSTANNEISLSPAADLTVQAPGGTSQTIPYTSEAQTINFSSLGITVNSSNVSDMTADLLVAAETFTVNPTLEVTPPVGSAVDAGYTFASTSVEFDDSLSTDLGLEIHTSNASDMTADLLVAAETFTVNPTLEVTTPASTVHENGYDFNSQTTITFPGSLGIDVDTSDAATMTTALFNSPKTFTVPPTLVIDSPNTTAGPITYGLADTSINFPGLGLEVDTSNTQGTQTMTDVLLNSPQNFFVPETRALTMTDGNGIQQSLQYRVGYDDTLDFDDFGIKLDIKGSPNHSTPSADSYNPYTDSLDGKQIEISPNRDLQVGADNDINHQLKLGITSVTASGLKIENESVVDVDLARVAITSLDVAIDVVNHERSYLASEQNRLAFTMSNLTSQTQNIEASRSSIQDTDFAADTADLAKNQILAQSATAMLAQASAISQNILGLLR